MEKLNNLDKLKSFINYHDNLEKIKIQTVLSYALQHDKNNLKEPCQYRNAVDHLLESWKKIIDVSVKDENGKTALHLAIERHCDCETHAEIVKKILDCYNCNLKDNCCTSANRMFSISIFSNL